MHAGGQAKRLWACCVVPSMSEGSSGSLQVGGFAQAVRESLYLSVCLHECGLVRGGNTCAREEMRVHTVCFILSQPRTSDKRGWHLGRRYADVAAYAEYAKQLLAEEASGFQLIAQECHRAGERPAPHPGSANDGYCAAEEAESSAESIPPVPKSKMPVCVGPVAVEPATGLPFGESSSRGHDVLSQEALAASHSSRVLTPLAMVYPHCTHACMRARTRPVREASLCAARAICCDE